MQLDHVTIVAPHCDALMRFFVDIAGMEVGARPPFGVGGYWLYLGGRPVVHLVAAGIDAPAQRPGTARIDHVALRIDDADEWRSLLQRLDCHGYAYQLADVPLSGERQLFVQLAPAVVVEFVTTQS
ncbi:MULTISPECIES: VOC family protein [unclassified Caballeronia]|uniref:VOC family protein n=1 Tax=unclassified Caballeronia TaxID=2646786 RepID=UPI0028677757|nr:MULTISPECIES: VOC family protein [unclassified Caballeronia]MDR5812439.1 extradiol dioxygenase [Caballeronia sp. LZ033]MDR5819263.1 extradiol dioxygenase [Caballeronia sp. LZ043]